ncbi:MAG: UPF0147 family protein [Thermoplasmata archaeon]|nr:UPF0147 family protein [Thermoplasmata archaeon]
MNEEGLKTVLRMLEELANDISVPRNIRRGAKEAKEILMKKEDTLDVKVASAISRLDELLSDPNIPTHGRTAIWNIMSALESLTAS